MKLLQTTKKLVSVLVIIGILIPNVTLALLDDVIDFGKCALDQGLKAFLGHVLEKIISVIKSLIKAIICGVVSWFTFGLISCGYDNVESGSGKSLQAKEYFKDAVARCLARQMLSSMTDSIVGIMRSSGREGGPTFVENWRNFQTDAQYRGEDVFRSMLASTDVCEHFSGDLKTIFNANQAVPLAGQNTRVGDLDPYQLRANCTLPDGFNVNSYSQDPAAYGGWETFLRLQQPQNNLYGSMLMAMDEVDNQRQIEQSGDVNETLGHGFTARRTTPNGNLAASQCLSRGPNGQCLVYRNIDTPGFILGETTVNTIATELSWVVGVDEIHELMSDMSQVLIDRLFRLGSGTQLASNQPIELDPQIDGGLTDDCASDPRLCDSSGPTNPAEPTPVITVIFPPTGGGGVCADDGLRSIDYESQLAEAIIQVNIQNPGGIADQLNTTANSFQYLNEVASMLGQLYGLNATTNVLNGNDNQNSGDLIAVWSSGDSTVERYDAIIAVGAGDRPLWQAATAGNFTGDIPLSCAGN